MRTDTETPRLFRIRPMDATLTPLPTELTTPPVTKIILAIPLLGWLLPYSPTRQQDGRRAAEGDRLE